MGGGSLPAADRERKEERIFFREGRGTQHNTRQKDRRERSDTEAWARLPAGGSSCSFFTTVSLLAKRSQDEHNEPQPNQSKQSEPNTNKICLMIPNLSICLSVYLLTCVSLSLLPLVSPVYLSLAFSLTFAFSFYQSSIPYFPVFSVLATLGSIYIVTYIHITNENTTLKQTFPI
ncbi:hypothetical protein GGR53DRAFT_482606, partial [Hypoxylon sp. FL1150]